MIKKWQISLAIALMILGIMISFQFKTQQTILNDLKQQKDEDLLTMLESVNNKNFDLKRQQADLAQQLNDLTKNNNEGLTLFQSLEKDMTNMEIALGTKPVKGSGIKITITYNPRPNDIPIIVNDLWNTGAEAIAINGKRLNFNTALSNDEQYILPTINGKYIEFPAIIEAIGPADNMKSALYLPNRPLDVLKKFENPAEVKSVDNLILPSVDNAPTFDKAKVK